MCFVCVAAVSWLAREKLLLMLLEGLKNKVKRFTSVMSDWASKETGLIESVTWPCQTPQGLHMNLSKSQTTVIHHFAHNVTQAIQTSH